LREAVEVLQRSPFGAATGLSVVLVISASCAGCAGAGSPAPASSLARTGNASCSRTGAGFALSLSVDGGGQPTPRAAAVHFGEHGGVPGYRAASNTWVEVPSPTDSQGQTVDGVTLRADDLFLHVIQLNDDTWAVDSGGHCASGS
jgi:hypothetical protein